MKKHLACRKVYSTKTTPQSRQSIVSITAITIAAIIVCGAFYASITALPPWAMQLFMSIAYADGDMTQNPGGSVNSGEKRADAKTVTQINTVANTQDIPDAIAQQGAFSFTYFEGGIYKIYCKEGFLTDIELQAGEKITAILGGDTARWMVDKASAGSAKGEQWHIYIKPLKADLTTNFIITTDRHSYQIEVMSGNWFCPMVSWLYPEEAAALFRAQQEKDKNVVNLASTSPDHLNFSYYFDKKGFRWNPTAVFDDGLKTYIRMPSTMASDEAPVFLIVDDTGNLLLANYRIQNNAYIIDRLFTSAELKVGKDVVKIRRLDV